MIKLKINKKQYRAEEGRRIIDFCREKGIEIASLCDHWDFASSNGEKGQADSGVCRLCMIKAGEAGQEKKLAPACRLKAREGLEIITEDAEIANLRRINLELLFADHFGLCANCVRNGDCELQRLAQKYDIDEERFSPASSELESRQELDLLFDKMSRRVIDDKNPCISKDSEKCIKCRRCVRICRDFQSVEAYSFHGKGVKSDVGTEYNAPLECTYCGQCTTVCPTAALTEKSDIGKLLKAMNDPEKMVVIQTAPSIRVALGEEFGMVPGAVVTGKMVTALREMGADLVFDTNLGADLTIMEEAAELVQRVKHKDKPLPLFTSCCSAWVLFLERYYPEFLDHLSTCRSPQMMMGSLIKNYWAEKNSLEPARVFAASVMPCISKKYEIQRPEFIRKGVNDLDCVITTRELGRLLREREVDFGQLKDSEFDPALGIATSAGAIFGTSGGVMEAALRTAYHFITDKEAENVIFSKVRGEEGVRTAEFTIGSLRLRTKIVHGLANARKVMESMKKGERDFDFLEVMACPNGCIGGGGQPVPTSPSIRARRAAAIYNLDEKMELRRSHENPIIEELYDKFLISPGSRKAEKYLHTSYYPHMFDKF